MILSLIRRSGEWKKQKQDGRKLEESWKEGESEVEVRRRQGHPPCSVKVQSETVIAEELDSVEGDEEDIKGNFAFHFVGQLHVYSINLVVVGKGGKGRGKGRKGKKKE